MEILEPLQRNRMRPAWRFEPGGIIWRIVPAGDDLLLGEARATPTKEVSFFCVDLRTGAALWDRREFGFGWWTGIEAVFDGVGLIHGFASPDMPQHRGLAAIDLRSGREIWSRPDARFIGFAGGLVVVETGSGDLGLELDLDLRTGFVRRSRPAAASGRPSGLNDAARGCDVQFPRSVDGPDGIDAEVFALVSEHHPHTGLGAPPQFLDTGSAVIVSYYESLAPGGRTYRNILKIIEPRRRQLLYEEVLDAEVTSAVPESFLLTGSLLLYVRERRVLTALRLN